MNQSEFFGFLKDCHAKEEDIVNEKNSVYSSKQDPFSNFRRYGTIHFLTRIYEKFNRIENLLDESKKVEGGESIEDTILDMSNYLHLLLGFLKEKDEKSTK